MKITYYDNACCVYETAGFKLMSDPWLTNGAFEGSWFHPLNARMPTTEELKEINALYISHLHPDHYDPNSLHCFDKSLPILILNKEPNYLKRKIQELGFQNIVEFKDKETKEIGPFKITMYAPFVEHPFDQSDLGNFLDSAIVVEDGECRVLNANDNTPTVESAKQLRAIHGKFDFAQLKYAMAGPYPSCFLDLTHHEKLEEKNRLLARQKSSMNEVATVLAAEAVPFAGSYILAGSLAYKNQYLAVDHLDLSQVPDGKPYDYELDPAADSEKVFELCVAARQQLWKRQKKLNYFPNITISIRLKSSRYFSFNFSGPGYGTETRGDLTCIMDLRLLRRILLRQSHWNNAEVGCHIDFIREPNHYNPDISSLMSFFHC